MLDKLVRYIHKKIHTLYGDDFDRHTIEVGDIVKMTGMCTDTHNVKGIVVEVRGSGSIIVKTASSNTKWDNYRSEILFIRKGTNYEADMAELEEEFHREAHSMY